MNVESLRMEQTLDRPAQVEECKVPKNAARSTEELIVQGRGRGLLNNYHLRQQTATTCLLPCRALVVQWLPRWASG